MKVSGTSHVGADRETVWSALNDPAVLVRTIPGCVRLETVGEDTYAMTISAGVASVKGVYQGQVRLSEQQRPGSFRLHAKGAGAPGTIGADVLVELVDGPDGGTDLTYDADATVGGMIGGVGQRMLSGVSKKMAAEFFTNVEGALTGAAPKEVPGARSVASAETIGPGFTAPGVSTSSTSGRDFVKGIAVGAGLVLAGVIAGGLFGRRGPRR